MHIEARDVGRSARRITREPIWREFVLRQIGIAKRANITLFPPHNSRACIKFQNEIGYYHVGRIIEVRTSPNSARVIPQFLVCSRSDFIWKFPYKSQLNSFYTTRIYMGYVRRSWVSGRTSGEYYSRMINFLRIEVISNNLDNFQSSCIFR